METWANQEVTNPKKNHLRLPEKKTKNNDANTKTTSTTTATKPNKKAKTSKTTTIRATPEIHLTFRKLCNF